MFTQLNLAWLCQTRCIYAVAERATPVLLNDLLMLASYKMQRIKTSQILILQIKPVTKLKSSQEKLAIRYVCKYPSKGLGKVHVGLDDSPVQLYVLGEHFELLDTVISTTSTSYFCKIQVDQVQLYCYCLTPWIEKTVV